MPARHTPLIGFRRHLRATSVPDEAAIYLVSARGTVALSGEPIRLLAPLLEGNYDLAELRQRVAPEVGGEQLDHLLNALTRAKLVRWRPPADADPEPEAAVPEAAAQAAADGAVPEAAAAAAAAEAYWDLADGTVPRPGTDTVRLVVLDREDGVLASTAVTATEALRSAGITTAGPEETAVPAVVLCDDYLDPRLAEINAGQLAAGRPWLLAKPTGADLWVGPVFYPGQGPCWACLAPRLRGHRRGEVLLREAGAEVRVPEASLPCTRLLGLQLAVLETVKWLAGAVETSRDAIWTLDTVTLTARRHPVPKRPQCAACGDAGTVPALVRRPVVPSSRPKAPDNANGHRALALQQVWQRYQHLVDPVTGIVGGIQRDPRCPDFLHSYLSGPNLAVTGTGLARLRTSLRQQSGGKGRTDLEARVSALCEAVERYCGSRLGDEPTVRASLRELGSEAIHPDQCQLFHQCQYRDRHRWNASNAGFQQVPEPFDGAEVLDWTPVWSLTEHRHRLLPTDLLYFSRCGHPAVRATSNGNAAGASVEDAIVQGFLELVERDAVALWWYNRTRQPAVDLESFADPWIFDLRRRYAGIGRELWVLDVSSDFDLPVMVAVSRRIDKPAEDLMLGFGAHFDPAVAMRRALTELGQLLPAVVDAQPDGTGYAPADQHIRWWWQAATIANQPYLRPHGSRPPRRLADYPNPSRADLRDDVEQLVALAGDRGLQVLVLDQTRPDIGMPVVKVVVPGLRHFWARFAPGRLYDVPVRLGRLDTPTPYADLNPIPLFL